MAESTATVTDLYPHSPEVPQKWRDMLTAATHNELRRAGIGERRAAVLAEHAAAAILTRVSSIPGATAATCPDLHLPNFIREYDTRDYFTPGGLYARCEPVYTGRDDGPAVFYTVDRDAPANRRRRIALFYVPRDAEQTRRVHHVTMWLNAASDRHDAALALAAAFYNFGGRDQHKPAPDLG